MGFIVLACEYLCFGFGCFVASPLVLRYGPINTMRVGGIFNT